MMMISVIMAVLKLMHMINNNIIFVFILKIYNNNENIQ